MSNDSILAIKDILNEYSSDIQDAITQEAIAVSKKGVAELKNNSPKNTGKYRKGWRVKTEKGKGYVSCVIHNATNWQLTHLLEKPHAIRNQFGSWGTSIPKPHIAPVEQQCVSEYKKNVERIIRNGG